VSAGGALQTAIAAVLGDIDGLSGAFDGPPARAAFPYTVMDATTETDWSHKSGSGREVMVALTVWDDQPARLQQLADAAEAKAIAVKVSGGWSLVTLRMIRRRTIRDVAGPWATAIDFRARLLAAA
jgi:hypothetical protein